MFAWLRALGLALLASLMLGAPAQAKWLKAETKHFVLYGNGSERSLRDYATKIEVFHEALTFFHPIDDSIPAEKLEIYLVRDKDDMDRIWPRATGVAGFYRADPDGTFAVVSREFETMGDSVLFHEYTHHYMLRYFAYPYPAWLVEGMAEYFGSSAVYRDHIEIGLPNNSRGPSLDSWYISSRDLFGKKREGDVYLFYARAWLLTHFMMAEDGRRQQLDQYMRLVGEGGDSITSLEKALGYNIETLDKNLRAYLKQRIPYTSIKRKDVDVAMTVTPMPASADDVLLERLRLINGIWLKDAPAVLKNIQSRADRHPNDRLAQLTLARAHVFYGDPAAAQAILQPYVADTNDAEANFLMGLRYARMAEKELGWDAEQARREAEALKDENDEDDDEAAAEPERIYSEDVRARAADWYAKARPWFVKANRADPDSYEILYAFAETRMLDDDYPSKDTMQILAAAYQRAPQVDAITMANARALIAHRRYDDASTLLRLLANDPHGGSTALTAQAMLEGLPDGKQPAAN